jgi:putative hydrolase of the HAD superfamily
VRRNDLNGRPLVVFDGDDTLWRTQELYDTIKVRFVDLIADKGLQASTALSLLHDIDSSAVSAQGFTVARFVDSMIRTYHSLAASSGRRAEAQTEQAIRDLASPLLGDYELFPDAIAVLKLLAPHYKLVLATKGQRDLQLQKIRRLGLRELFDELYIIDRKTETEYGRILRLHQTPASRAWAVGNSVRSDINPALHLGMHAIWVRRRTWLYEDAVPVNDDVTAVDSLSEAADVLLARAHQAMNSA